MKLKEITKTTRGVLLSLASGLLAGVVHAEDFKVAIVLPGVITDRSFNQAGYEGVEPAAKELDIEFSYSEMTAQPHQPQALSDYARRGYDLLIGHGGEFQESLSRIAGLFPDTQFLIVNGTESSENVATMSFDFSAKGSVMGYVSGSHWNQVHSWRKISD